MAMEAETEEDKGDGVQNPGKTIRKEKKYGVES